MRQLLHTPEGVRDIYNGEESQKEALCSVIGDVFFRYGYQRIQPPTCEYFDIFSEQRGTVPSREMYKLIDRDGETLVMRPDYTPSIARCAAKYYAEEELPVRLCYQGNTYINHSGLQGRLKETTQAGGELIGDPTAAADAEVLALGADCLKAAGLKEFQLEIGQTEYFAGLVEEAALDPETADRLRELIEAKNYLAVEELIGKSGAPGRIAEVFKALPELFGPADEVLGRADRLAVNSRMKGAVVRLREICGLLKSCRCLNYITVDMGLLGSYRYYTGIIFKGYTYGTGDCIVTGGRYDDLIGQFGKDAPSVGIGIAVDTLLSALARQKIALPVRHCDVLLVCEDDKQKEALKEACRLRREGKAVLMLRREGRTKEACRKYGAEQGIRNVVFF